MYKENIMALSVNINEKENEQLEHLAKAFNLSKAAVLRNLAFNNIKQLKPADYNLVYAELLQLNKNVSELLNFIKKNGAEAAAESVFLLYEIKDKIEEIEKKI